MADNPNETPRSTFDRNDTESEVAFFKALFRMYANSVQTCIPVIVLDRENEYGFIKVKPIIKSKAIFFIMKHPFCIPGLILWYKSDI